MVQPEAVMEREDQQIQAARYGMLSEVVLLISETADLQHLLKQLIGKVKWVLDFNRCTLALLDDDQPPGTVRPDPAQDDPEEPAFASKSRTIPSSLTDGKLLSQSSVFECLRSPGDERSPEDAEL